MQCPEFYNDCPGNLEWKAKKRWRCETLNKVNGLLLLSICLLFCADEAESTYSPMYFPE
jgi:hypothetical protein